MQQHYIEARNLVKNYKGRNVVNGVHLRIESGQIVGLLGPNGAGKTTTFYMIMGLITPNEGTIYLDKEDVTKVPMHLRARMGIAYLPQEASIFRKLTVEENLLSLLEFTELTKKEQKARVQELLKEFRVEHVRNYKGIQLSGGERRRVEIARALTLDPKFLLLDEPFAGVDPIAVAEIQEIIAYLKKRGVGILITDHNVRETMSIVDNAYIVNEGNILLAGKPELVAENDLAKKFFLGEKFTL